MHNIIHIDKDSITQQDILDAKENIDLLYIPNLVPSTTGWDEFIDHCDYTVKHPEFTLPSPVKVIGALQIWDEFFVAGYYVENGDCFSQLKEVFAKTTELFGREPNKGCTLINFVGQQKTIPVHTDSRDSFLWQAIGSVEWRVFETTEPDSPYQSLTVNPGDMLFVPSGIIHTVFCENPRAGISVFYDKQE
jgi:quercetin dioxygenase-like cupin family protein